MAYSPETTALLLVDPQPADGAGLPIMARLTRPRRRP